MKKSQIEEAKLEFPIFLATGTSMPMENISDLVSIAQYELDLYEQGEENGLDTLPKLNSVKNFIKKWEGE